MQDTEEHRPTHRPVLCYFRAAEWGEPTAPLSLTCPKLVVRLCFTCTEGLLWHQHKTQAEIGPLAAASSESDSSHRPHHKTLSLSLPQGEKNRATRPLLENKWAENNYQVKGTVSWSEPQCGKAMGHQEATKAGKLSGMKPSSRGVEELRKVNQAWSVYEAAPQLQQPQQKPPRWNWGVRHQDQHTGPPAACHVRTQITPGCLVCVSHESHRKVLPDILLAHNLPKKKLLVKNKRKSCKFTFLVHVFQAATVFFKKKKKSLLPHNKGLSKSKYQKK